MIPTLQARIEAMPVDTWPAELAKIQDDEIRARVRDHLKTVFLLSKKNPANTGRENILRDKK